MKKTILKFVAVLVAALSMAHMSCKQSSTGDELPAEQNVVSTGVTIGETTYAKTSEVAIVPAGETGVVDMKDDSSWNTYVVDSAMWKGVFIKDRKVILSPFVMGQYEVTQELYTAVMEVENPSFYKDDIDEGEKQKLRPVDTVNHYEAVAFCNELTKKTMTDADVVYFSDEAKTTAYTKTDATTKKIIYMDIKKNGYRLPTEAEWEYAARGGNPQAAEWKNAFGKVNTKGGKMIYDGRDFLRTDDNLATIGWYMDNSNGSKTHEVGLKNKNSLNLYDMAGNVEEWCWDGYEDDVETGITVDPCGATHPAWRVLRGGTCRDEACSSAVSFRIRETPSRKERFIGFRVCRSISK